LRLRLIRRRRGCSDLGFFIIRRRRGCSDIGVFRRRLIRRRRGCSDLVRLFRLRIHWLRVPHDENGRGLMNNGTDDRDRDEDVNRCRRPLDRDRDDNVRCGLDNFLGLPDRDGNEDVRCGSGLLLDNHLMLMSKRNRDDDIRSGSGMLLDSHMLLMSERNWDDDVRRGLLLMAERNWDDDVSGLSLVLLNGG